MDSSLAEVMMLRLLTGEASSGEEKQVGRLSSALGEEGCLWCSCSCPLAPGKGSAKCGNPTKRGSWKQMKRIPGAGEEQQLGKVVAWEFQALS